MTLVGIYLLVSHDCDHWIVQIEPTRYLTVGDQIDVADPRSCVLPDAAQRIFELVIVLEPVGS